MNKPTKKINKASRVYFDLDDCYPMEIDGLIDYLTKAKEAGAFEVKFEYDIDTFDGFGSLEQATLVYREATRLETDEEFNQRVQKWQAKQEELEKKEREELKRLQDKYST